ncbi:MAG: hypothetical protein HY754_00740 [Nitrospirae bacterium]|nr:hypothetical protein [Nitrospirota bacterium]
MKTNIIIVGLIAAILIPSIVFAIEKAPRISDREIVERLTRLEEGQKAILREIDKRFEAMDKRFSTLETHLNRLSAIFSAIVIALIGFAIWDRRTMVRPFEDKVKKIENDIAENRSKLHALLDALKSLSKTDEKVAEVLKKFNLL